MNKKILTLLLIITSILFGCLKKDDNETEVVIPEITKVSLLGTINNAIDDRAWDVKNKEYEMESKGNGIFEKTVRLNPYLYTWVNSDVSGANYAFKFAANGAWAGSGGVEFGAKDSKIIMQKEGTLIKTLKSGEANNIYISLEKNALYKFTLNTSESRYTIEKIGEPLSIDANLNSLKIEGVVFEKEFSPEITEYSGTIDGDTVAIEAVSNNKNAVITGAGKKNLVIGNNPFIITVTAENGYDIKEYKINIIRNYVNSYEQLEKAYNAMTEIKLAEINDVTLQDKKLIFEKESIIFPTVIENVGIDWFSENQGTVENNGKIIRPEYEQGDREVKVYAILKIDEKTSIKEFTVLVKAKAEVEIKSMKLLGTINGTGDDAWSISNSDYDMTYKDKGIFEKVVRVPKETASWIAVENANYAFKFVANGAWANNEGTAGVEYGAEKDNELKTINDILYKSRTQIMRVYNIYLTLEPGSEYRFMVDTKENKYSVLKTGGALSGDNELKSIEVENYKIAPEFSPEILKYDLTVTPETEKISLKAIPKNEKAVIKESITGEITADINYGQNIIKITVEAEDKTTREYTVVVLRNNVERATISQTEAVMNINGSYTLPQTAKTVLTDGTIKEYKLIWDTKDVDTTKTGTYYAKSYVPEIGKTFIFKIVVIISSGATDKDKIEDVKNKLTIANVDAIKYDISLPKQVDGIKIEWTSDNHKYITNEGKVTRPVYDEGDKEVNITATLLLNSEIAYKIFKVKVLKEEEIKPDYAKILQEAKDMLNFDNLNAVTSDMEFPAVKYGVSITWTTTDILLISNTGKVTRPANGEGNKEVVITAVLKIDTLEDTKQFKAFVIEQTPSTEDVNKLNIILEKLKFDIDLTKIISDIELVKEIDGALITWKSNNSAITNEGKVTRPTETAGDSSGTLIATVTYKSISEIKVFNTIVLKKAVSDEEKLLNAKNNLSIPGNLNEVITNITLKTELDGVKIVWISDKLEVISVTGLVTRPEYREGNKSVKLTAELTYGTAKDFKEFLVTVIKKEAKNDAYLSDIKVNGATIEGFLKDKEIYTYMVDALDIIPLISVKTTDTQANYTITNAVKIPGETKITVTAEDGVTVKTYIISFMVKSSSDASLKEIKVNNLAVAGFKEDYYEYKVELTDTKVPDIQCIASNIKSKIDILKPAGIPGQVRITVTAEDGVTQKIYKIDLTLLTSSSKKILSFKLTSPAVTGVIDESLKTIKINVPSGTNVSSLNTTITVSEKANVSPSSGTAQNFTLPVKYTVTAEDGSKQEYMVTVEVGKSSEKQLKTFSFSGLTPVVAGTINESAKTISLTVPNGTNVTALAATFTFSTGANVKVGGVAQVSGTTTNNYTNPIIYRVTAEDGTFTDYTVTVMVEDLVITYNSFTKGELVYDIFRNYSVTATVNSSSATKIEIYSSDNLISEIALSGKTGSVTFMVSKNTTKVNFKVKNAGGDVMKTEEKNLP